MSSSICRTAIRRSCLLLCLHLVVLVLLVVDSTEFLSQNDFPLNWTRIRKRSSFHVAAFSTTPFSSSRVPSSPSIDNDKKKNNNINQPNWIYNVPDSGWTCPEWKWNSPNKDGTAQICIDLCRQRYATSDAREGLIQDLLESHPFLKEERRPFNFEEVKLVLALAWQEARTTDLEAFGQILDQMVLAERYEIKQNANIDPITVDADEHDISTMDPTSALLRDRAMRLEQEQQYERCLRFFIQDIQKRFMWLYPTVEDKITMNMLLYEHDNDIDLAVRKCAGLVLKNMDWARYGEGILKQQYLPPKDKNDDDRDNNNELSFRKY